MATGGIPIAWTPDMDAVLREGLAAGIALARVAEEIGVAEGTAKRRAVALGLDRPRRQRKPRRVSLPRIPMEMRFAELLAEGFTPQEAGHRVGCARGNSMLQRIRAKLGEQAV